MQVPTTIDGLRKVLMSLGYRDATTGLDAADPSAKQHCVDQIDWEFNQSDQNMQDAARRRKALSYIEQFPWPATAMNDVARVQAELEKHNMTLPIENLRDSGIRASLKALSELGALLDEEMVLDPVEVEEYIDEDGDDEVDSILIRRAASSIDAARTALMPPMLDLPGLDDVKKAIKRLRPKSRTIGYMGKDIKVLPWVDLGRYNAWDDDTRVVIVADDFTWYGPYTSPALATRSAWNISTKGDNEKRRVPMKDLVMVRERDWPPARAWGRDQSKMHKLAARLSDWKGDFVHFTKKPFIKLNPKPHHGDPVGIYLFPETFDPETPFWHRMNYKFTVRLKPSAKVLDLSELSAKEALDLTRKVIGVDPHNAEKFLETGESKWDQPGDKMWDAFRQHFGTRKARWNKALQRAGYDAVFDDTRAIHGAEVQLLVLNPKAIKVLDMESTKTGSGFAEVKMVSQQLAKGLKHLGKVKTTEPRNQSIGWGGEKGLQAQVEVKADDGKYVVFKVTSHAADQLVRVSLAYSSPSKEYGVGADYNTYTKKWYDSWRGSGIDYLVKEAESLLVDEGKLAARTRR